MFIHDEQQKNQEVRAGLEAAAKELINRKLDQSPAGKEQRRSNKSELDLEYSIIEPNERNKISFLKEPSFINRKSEQEDFLRCSQVDCGQLLTSRNFLHNQETTKNIELLEQRILSSEANEEEEKASPTSKITSFLKEDVHGLSFTPMIVLESKEMSAAAVDTEGVEYKHKARPGHSRSRTSNTSKSSNQGFNYATIFIFLCILFGLNLILNAIS
jgi:hypothetical protein